jgi:hypothetical protein
MAKGLDMNTRHWLLGAATLCPALPSTTTAYASETGASAQPAPPSRFSPFLSAGPAFVAIGYEEYSLGAILKIGIDRKLMGALDQRVGAVLSFTRFTIPGAALDLLGTEASYRVYPMKAPLYVGASAGVLVLRESFDVRLPEGRTIDDVTVRAGAPVSVALGVTLFQHAELEAGYRHAFFFGGEGAASFGQAAITLGGRL